MSADCLPSLHDIYRVLDEGHRNYLITRQCTCIFTASSNGNVCTLYLKPLQNSLLTNQGENPLSHSPSTKLHVSLVSSWTTQTTNKQVKLICHQTRYRKWKQLISNQTNCLSKLNDKGSNHWYLISEYPCRTLHLPLGKMGHYLQICSFQKLN